MYLLSSEDFNHHWKPIYEKIFTGLGVADGCFRHSSWTAVLVPRPVGVTYLALKLPATLVGDEQCVVTDIEGTPPHEESVLINWEWEDIRQLGGKTLLTACDAALFGSSARWGALSMQSEDGYTCIGGDEVFMTAFIAAAGGEQQLKERFTEFAKEEWFLAEEQKRKILKAVGWGYRDQTEY
jgi:hypothetical protein